MLSWHIVSTNVNYLQHYCLDSFLFWPVLWYQRLVERLLRLRTQQKLSVLYTNLIILHFFSKDWPVSSMPGAVYCRSFIRRAAAACNKCVSVRIGSEPHYLWIVIIGTFHLQVTITLSSCTFSPLVTIIVCGAVSRKPNAKVCGASLQSV